ncbi:MAG: hypothetical protein ACR2FU_00705 [Streptosporangiaceae bacterium]
MLRRVSQNAPRIAARRFYVVAWPAYGVLVATGTWNIAAAGHMSASYQATLTAKVAVVAASGITAFLHTRAKTPAGPAIWGALTGLTALGALFLGIQLAG